MTAQNGPKLPNLEVRALGDKLQDSVKSELNDKQLQALDLLVGGAKFSYIAEELNIGRRTLFDWRTKDEAFINELRRRREELREFGIDRFRNLTWLALDRIESQIRDPYAPISLPAARTIVTLARLGQTVSTPDGLVHRDPNRMQHEKLKET